MKQTLEVLPADDPSKRTTLKDVRTAEKRTIMFYAIVLNGIPKDLQRSSEEGSI